MTVRQVCGGTLFTPEAGTALEHVMGTSEFVVEDGQADLSAEGIAKVMEDNYRSGRDVADADAAQCRIKGAPKQSDGGKLRSSQAAVVFLGHKRSAAEASGPRLLREGRAHTVKFDCVSSRVGSTRQVPLRISADFSVVEGDVSGTATAAADGLVLVHSAAVSVAEELGCENKGGLPGRPGELEQFSAES
ncbi:hypothetical protein [Streptomyces sp. NPDC002082]|uniref:hypothetical protein n=1 Tax=Streptomyces sp. NPDC002082 TaxID=3154772 RepID=UPI00332ABCC9